MIKNGIPALGRICITTRARELLTDKDICNTLARHKSGDWGDVSKADHKMNNRAVRQGTRIISAYISTGGEKFWIITEADRSYTTILLPEEY